MTAQVPGAEQSKACLKVVPPNNLNREYLSNRADGLCGFCSANLFYYGDFEVPEVVVCKDCKQSINKDVDQKSE
jgi:hypothetical protein